MTATCWISNIPNINFKSTFLTKTSTLSGQYWSVELTFTFPRMVNFYSTPKSFYNPFVKCSFTSHLFCQRLTEVWSSIWFETGLTSSDNLFGFWLLFQITNHFINFASATNIRCYVLPQIRDIKFNVSNTFNVKRSFFICFLVC